MKKFLIVAFSLFAALSLFADVTATAVKGVVGVLASGKLQPVSVDMRLRDDATIVTGANSELTITVNNGTLTFKSLTTARLSGIAKTDTSSSAAVALKSGTVVSSVKQIQGLKTNFTVTTPVGTSSVRGTTHAVSYSAERGMGVSVSSGVVTVSSARGAARPVAAGRNYEQAQSASPPQVSTQAVQEAATTGAVAAFAPPEETAIAAASGNDASILSEIVSLVLDSPTSGTVHVSLVFP